MYSRRLSVGLVLTGFTLNLCTENIGTCFLKTLLMGFKTKGYNKCTFNKMINGYQCTIQVHVDDLKLLHVHQDELNKIIDALNEDFESDGGLLTASYGRIRKYLGIPINWTTEGMNP